MQLLDVLAKIRDDTSTAVGDGIVTITSGYNVVTFTDPNSEAARGRNHLFNVHLSVTS